MSDTKEPSEEARKCAEDCHEAGDPFYSADSKYRMALVLDAALRAAEKRGELRGMERAASFASRLRARLRADSKGELETWGFVALFMQMIDDIEKEMKGGS